MLPRVVPQAPKRWLFGPFSDLFFGCGLIYCLAFVALVFAGPQMRQILPMELMPLLLLVSGVPHYGATLLRVYHRREDRQRYALFATWATLLVAAAFVVSVYEFSVGSAMVTLYLTWSPWHYSAQNYGIAMMFLRRRQVEVSNAAQRFLKWSFTLSFLLTFLALHGAGATVTYAPVEDGSTAYTTLRSWIPYDYVRVLVPILFGAYLTCLVGAAVSFRRTAFRELLPSALLVGSQAIWFTVPMLARHTGILQGIEPLGTMHYAYVFTWIAVAHSVQYVWITSYFARQMPDPPSHAGYLTRILLAGAGIWIVPGLVFAPAVLGTVDYDGGLWILIAAAVNIHHFILDGAIWKLRDGAVARILLRGQTESGPSRPPNPAIKWGLRAVGAASVAIWIWGPLETAARNEASATGDLRRLENANDRLRWMGRESSRVHAHLALAHQRSGSFDAARRHAEAADTPYADYDTIGSLVIYYQQENDPAAVMEKLEAGLVLRPDSARSAKMLADLLIARERSNPASVARAVELAELAEQKAYDDKAPYLQTLTMAYATARRLDDAVRTAQAGLAATEPGTPPHEWFKKRIAAYRGATTRRN